MDTQQLLQRVPSSLTRRSLVTGAVAAVLAPALRALAAPPRREGSFKYVDPRLGEKLPERGWQIYSPSIRTRNGAVRDPKYNISYPLSVGVNCIEDFSDRTVSGERRFEVLYVTKADEPFARLVGSVLARLHWIGLDYLGVSTGRMGLTTVWLAREGKPGAEESDGNIWLHAIDTPRAPAEWVREIAHEYAHITLPTLGPFAKPERWANGYLGERLFLKWMLADNRQHDVWSEPIDGAAYVANQVAPLRDRFLNEGPDAPDAAKIDEAGMDFLIGKLLALEAAHGPALMRELVSRIGSPSVKGLEVILATAIRALKPARLPIAPGAFVPRATEGAERTGESLRVQKAGYRVYLPAGSWAVDAEGVVPPDAKVTLDGVALSRAASQRDGMGRWEAGAASDTSGWKLLEIAAPAGKTVELRGLAAVRPGELG
jgi:hypothetical protein